MKKVISLLLVVAMLIAIVTVSFNALSVSDEGVISINEMLENEGITPGPGETQRIYFQMPNGSRGEAVDHDITVHKVVSDPETGDPIDEYDEIMIPAGGKEILIFDSHSPLKTEDIALILQQRLSL